MSSAVYSGVFGAYTIGQITQSDYQPNKKVKVDCYSGELDGEQFSIVQADPVITLTTADLYSLIGSASATEGLAMTSAGTITIPFQNRASGGTYQGSGSHHTLSATLGLLVPTEIMASQDSEDGAQAKLEIYPASTDGLTNPVAINDSITLSGQSFVASYDLGPFKIGSTLFSQIASAKVTFGLMVPRKRYNGETWSRIAGITIVTRRPQLEVTFCSAADLKTFDHYSALNTTATAFFRKRSAGGTHVADGTGGHVSCTITTGIQTLQSASASKSDDATFTRVIQGKTLSFSRTATIS